jgi:hypothetical protein
MYVQGTTDQYSYTNKLMLFSKSYKIFLLIVYNI